MKCNIKYIFKLLCTILTTLAFAIFIFKKFTDTDNVQTLFVHFSLNLPNETI